MTITAKPTTTRLDSLTGIRAFAVALVFWHHGAEPFDAVSVGMVGVSLFYLLSGFVMAWTDREADTPGQFYRRRFARIVPAYLVAVAIAIGFKAIRGDLAPIDFAALTMMQSWLPDRAVYFAADAVFWSLSCEVFFYLVFPWLRLIVRRLTNRGVQILAVAAGLSSFAVATIGQFLLPESIMGWAVIVFPPSRLPEFILGVALGTLFARGWRPRVSLWFAVSFAAVGVVAAMVAPYAYSRYAATLIPFAVLIVALAAADLGGNASFARWAPIVKLGVWSYCFYLIHNLVLQSCMVAAAKLGIPALGAVVIAVLLSIVAAWLLHVLVERPFEQRLRPRGRPRLDTDVPPAA